MRILLVMLKMKLNWQSHTCQNSSERAAWRLALHLILSHCSLLAMGFWPSLRGAPCIHWKPRASFLAFSTSVLLPNSYLCLVRTIERQFFGKRWAEVQLVWNIGALPTACSAIKFFPWQLGHMGANCSACIAMIPWVNFLANFSRDSLLNLSADGTTARTTPSSWFACWNTSSAQAQNISSHD